MAARNYNPNSFAISQKVEDVIEHYNNMKNPSGQPLIFHQARPHVIRNREHGHYSDVRLVGGSRRMLALDESQPMMRPPGMIDSHQAKSGKYIMNGNSATYPVYNAVEQKAIDKSKSRGKSTPLEGEGIWEDMNKWGKQNERNIIALSKDPRVLAIVNDPKVQEQAKALGVKAIDLAKSQLTKKGSGRPRGRPRKGSLEGDGLWEDMNAWGRQNEANFNKFGRDTEAAFRNAGVQLNAWGRKNVERVTQALQDPRVMAVLNDPAVQKLGKQAVKMAVSYIPVIGPPAAQVLGLLGFGKGANTRAAIVKQVMQEKGLSLVEASKYVKQHNLYTPRGKLKGGMFRKDDQAKEHAAYTMQNMIDARKPPGPRITERGSAAQAERFTELLAAQADPSSSRRRKEDKEKILQMIADDMVSQRERESDDMWFQRFKKEKKEQGIGLKPVRFSGSGRRRRR